MGAAHSNPEEQNAFRTLSIRGRSEQWTVVQAMLSNSLLCSSQHEATDPELRILPTCLIYLSITSALLFPRR